MRRPVRHLLLLVLVLLGGCAAVQPHQREILSRPIMQFDYDKDEAAARGHFLNSVESATGAFGIGGGGCGCN